jgi:hypothetical protein
MKTLHFKNLLLEIAKDPAGLQRATESDCVTYFYELDSGQ